jgi:DNA-binding NarL/FixJ family response regulator
VLRQHLDAALKGHGSLVLIGGEAGIGKTTLAEMICRDAVERGAIVLVGRSYDLTETPPYGPWTELFSTYRPAEDDPPLPAAVAQCGTVATVASQAVLVQRVLDFLIALAARQPVLLLLDDFHWADVASLDLLRFLARSLGDRRILVMASFRSEEIARQHPLYPLVPLLVREASAGRIDLHPLDDMAVRALVDARYDLEEADVHRLVTHLRGRAEGNALYVTETLRSLEQTEVLRHAGGSWTLGLLDEVGVPPLLRQVIDARVARLSDETQRLLAVAAVIGHEVEYAVWDAVADVAEERLLDAVAEAETAYLVTEDRDGNGLTFAHALVREAVYESARPSQRRRVHRAVGEALAALPDADPDAIAYHFRAVGDARAAGWLVKAGERAQRAQAWLMAASRYDEALTLWEANGATAHERGWLALRIALLRRNASSDAARFLDSAWHLAVAADDATLRAFVTFNRGLLHCYRRDYRQGLPEMAAGVAALDALTDVNADRLRAMGLLPEFDHHRGTLAFQLAQSGRYAEARALVVRMSSELPLDDVIGRIDTGCAADADHAWGDIHLAAGKPEEARRAFRRFRESYRAIGNEVQVALGCVEELQRVTLPYYADWAEERRALVAEASAAFQRAQGVQAHFAPRLAAIPLLCLEGGWEEARALTVKVRASANVRAWARPVVGTAFGPVARAQGDTALAWAIVRDGLPDGPATPPEEAFFDAPFALMRLAAGLALDAGDLEGAQMWMAGREHWLEWSGQVPDQAANDLDWAAYHRAAGDMAQAYERATHALVRATTPRQPLILLAAHRLLGELDTVAGRHAEAVAHLREAVTLADRCIVPHERALTLLAMAALRAAMEDTAVAQGLLDEVRTICLSLDAKPALARADALAARLTTARTIALAYPAGLSGREVEVLRLIAAGRTNREIADALFLSPGTVNVHVTHILTKTNTTNRTEAALFARDHGLA